MSQHGLPAVSGHTSASCGWNPQEPQGREDPWNLDVKCSSLLRAQGSQPQPQTFSLLFQREPGGNQECIQAAINGTVTWLRGTPRRADTFPQERSISAGDGWVGGVLSALPNKQRISSQGLRLSTRNGGEA